MAAWNSVARHKTVAATFNHRKTSYCGSQQSGRPVAECCQMTLLTSTDPLSRHSGNRVTLGRRGWSRGTAGALQIDFPAPPSRHQRTTPTDTLCPHSADRPGSTAGYMGSSGAWELTHSEAILDHCKCSLHRFTAFFVLRDCHRRRFATKSATAIGCVHSSPTCRPWLSTSFA
jgi:hypothetical protein